MSGLMENDDEEEYDDGFDDDMEALRQACMLTSTDLNDLNNNSPASSAAAAPRDSTGDSGSEEEEDDFELLRNVQKRFSTVCQPLSLKPLCALPPVSDNEEDDFEILAAVRRRFSAYDNTDNVKKPESSNDSTVACQVLTANCEDAANTKNTTTTEIEDMSGCSGFFKHQDQSNDCKSSVLELRYSSFPMSAQVLFDAIKRNRSCQKFLRSKLTQIEARIEENKELKDRVKILKDFQASCRKITGRALGLWKDPRIQLISPQKTLISENSKGSDKRISSMLSGPVENSHVANYRMALVNSPVSFERKKWTESEKENLRKGIRQQFQEMVLQFSVDQFSGSERSPGDTNDLDNILASIRYLEITPEKIREFLPKVNWDQLASMYVAGRSGAECEARWLNFEDPLINHSPWTINEDKNLLFIVQENGITNWFDIAATIGTNRTPFQCLARFQRSLNARILKREWTEEEDAQLRIAVETYGESNWQVVASTLEGRAGTQCSNRWKKTLHPDRLRVGRWTLDEDKRMKVAVKLFGPKNWRKIAQFVPGRTQVQCRERWVNSLDPSLKWDKWTEDEDLKLKEAIEEYGYRWSKVAECLTPRTDNQCWRRWKLLAPDEVPVLQIARKMHKAALISNFVDRESERPALGPNDFIPLPLIGPESEPPNANQSRKLNRKSRQTKSQKEEATPGNAVKKIRSKRRGKGVQISSEGTTEIANGTEVDHACGNHDVMTQILRPFPEKDTHAELIQDQLSSHTISKPLDINSGKQFDTRKKKPPKPHSKGKKLTETDSNAQTLRQVPPGSLEAGVANCDVSQTFGGNSTTSTKKRRAQKQQSKRNLNTKMGEEQNYMLSGTNNDDTELIHVHLDSNMSTITDGEGDIVGQPDASSKQSVCKPSTKRKIHLEMAGCTESLVSPSVISGLGSIEPSVEGQCVASVPCQQNSCKKSRSSGKPSSKQLLGTEDEDNVTLAYFFRHKSKKRKPEVAINTDQGCSASSMKKQSELPSEGVGKLNNEKEMASSMQDNEVQTSCNGGIAENISSSEVHFNQSEYIQTSSGGGKEVCGIDRVNCSTLSLQEPLKELERTSQEGEPVTEPGRTNQEVDDITLSSLLPRKLKKRRQILHESDTGALVEKVSKLAPRVRTIID